MWWALWWILTVLSALYTARRLWLSRPKELSLKDRADTTTLIARVLDDQERKWLWWHWKLATNKHDANYVFQAMPTPIRWKEPEPAPRLGPGDPWGLQVQVDPVPSSWRTKESTLTEGALWADQRNLASDFARTFPLVHDLEERIKNEAKSSGGSPRPTDRWSDLVYRSSRPHR
jgi:hypothetical protein